MVVLFVELDEKRGTQRKELSSWKRYGVVPSGCLCTCFGAGHERVPGELLPFLTPRIITGVTCSQTRAAISLLLWHVIGLGSFIHERFVGVGKSWGKPG